MTHTTGISSRRRTAAHPEPSWGAVRAGRGEPSWGAAP